MVAIPRGEFRRLDNWGDLIGLKGSGSHSVVVKDVFVPTHRVTHLLDMETRPVTRRVTRCTPIIFMPGASSASLSANWLRSKSVRHKLR